MSMSYCVMKERKMVNFKLGETNVKMKEPACYERGTKRATGFDSEASWKLSSARGTLRK